MTVSVSTLQKTNLSSLCLCSYLQTAKLSSLCLFLPYRQLKCPAYVCLCSYLQTTKAPSLCLSVSALQTTKAPSLCLSVSALQATKMPSLCLSVSSVQLTVQPSSLFLSYIQVKCRLNVSVFAQQTSQGAAHEHREANQSDGQDPVSTLRAPEPGATASAEAAQQQLQETPSQQLFHEQRQPQVVQPQQPQLQPQQYHHQQQQLHAQQQYQQSQFAQPQQAVNQSQEAEDSSVLTSYGLALNITRV